MKNLFSLWFLTSTPYVFPNENLQHLLKWRCVNLKGELMPDRDQQMSNTLSLIFFEKGVILSCQITLKTKTMTIWCSLETL